MITNGAPVLRAVSAKDKAPETDEAERSLARARAVGKRLSEGLEAVIFGQGEVVAGVVCTLLAGGHVLLEGAPGLGKTQIVRTLARLVGGASPASSSPPT